MTLRKELETKDLQNRLDKATAEVATAKEQHAAAAASVSHLQSKVADLQKQLTGSQEKLAVFERHSTAATGDANGANREQELEIAIAELRSELRNAQVEVEQAKGHVEQYKAIAQANEDSLAQIQTTYNQYKLETDTAVAQKDVSLRIHFVSDLKLTLSVTLSRNFRRCERDWSLLAAS